MATLPALQVIVEHPTITIKRGYDEQRKLNIYLHEYAEKDDQGRAQYTCYVTDRPAYEMTESPSIGYAETPEEAYEDALKEFEILTTGYDPRLDGGNYLGAIYFGDDPELEYLLFRDSSAFNWLDKLLLLTKQWQYPHLNLR